MECLVYTRCKRLIVPRSEIDKIVRAILKGEHRDGDVSIHLISDKKMRRLNNVYRGIAKTTDVLSFATDTSLVAADASLVKTNKDDELGDIFLCLPQIHRQARQLSVSVKEELTRMLAHGLLHLLGFDHIKPEQARKMFSRQERYVKLLCQ